ncbi:hypothetical protein HBN95_00380 [Chlamydia buteonis]|uniref:Uncharacterized protein n=2 Tax=Chlamydia/Chlamydophila group TaxID=1113537 RepID=A0ABX8L9G2_9CHLA|nr:hypothetical protein HBN95_00380 [Chlamydia buteonis]QXE27569.1 hypothetical protein JJJ19_02765 [Chlamydia buteonis]
MIFAPYFLVKARNRRRGVMATPHIQQELARLEFINDQLRTELEYVNTLLCDIGFPEGLTTIKAIAKEVLTDDDLLD